MSNVELLVGSLVLLFIVCFSVVSKSEEDKKRFLVFVMVLVFVGCWEYWGWGCWSSYAVFESRPSFSNMIHFNLIFLVAAGYWVKVALGWSWCCWIRKLDILKFEKEDFYVACCGFFLSAGVSIVLSLFLDTTRSFVVVAEIVFSTISFLVSAWFVCSRKKVEEEVEEDY